MPINDTPDFVDGGDPYDPAYEERYVSQRAEAASETHTSEREYVATVSRYYKEVFSPGETSAEAIEFVMKDLARWSRAFEPTFHPTNQKLQDLAEGRRETFQRIMQYTHLSADTLFVKYMMDAINRG